MIHITFLTKCPTSQMLVNETGPNSFKFHGQFLTICTKLRFGNISTIHCIYNHKHFLTKCTHISDVGTFLGYIALRIRNIFEECGETCQKWTHVSKYNHLRFVSLSDIFFQHRRFRTLFHLQAETFSNNVNEHLRYGKKCLDVLH